MRVVYLGSGEFGIPCLQGLFESDHALCMVVTQPPQPCGRGRKLRATAAADWAQARGVPCIGTENVLCRYGGVGDLLAPEIGDLGKG